MAHLCQFSPGLLQPWDSTSSFFTTLKELFRTGLTLSALMISWILIPRVVASSNPGLKLANAFGVKIQTDPLPVLKYLCTVPNLNAKVGARK
jgi:hypothetical protein